MKNKIFKLLLLTLLIILIVYFCYRYFNKNKLEKNNKAIIKTNEQVSNNYDFYYYSEDVVPEEDMEDNSFNVYKILYLFNDKTYFYKFALYGDTCGVLSKGTYSIDDDVLTLNENIRSGCDDCYYTKEMDIYKFIINDGKLITSDSEELIHKEADKVIDEIDFDKKYENCNSLLD